MSEVTGYNGWSNYETWLVSVWLNNDRLTYNVLESIRAKDLSVNSKAEELEELVRELYEFEPVSIVADFVNAALDRVNWLEIVAK
jgi:hypothetical protein